MYVLSFFIEINPCLFQNIKKMESKDTNEISTTHSGIDTDIAVEKHGKPTERHTIVINILLKTNVTPSNKSARNNWR